MKTHAVVYHGAPYGLNERGHIVSRHSSRALAEAALNRLSHIRECWDGRWRLVPTTATLDHAVVALVDGNLPDWRAGPL